ncbi:MAG TPA: glycosyltransferase family 4 protein [Chloroflexota bacterium]|nr:glycosyltransferase family 4 protein [Chloroflexota bacterium]
MQRDFPVRDGAASPDKGRAGTVRHVAVMMLAPFASGAEHQTLALCRYLRQRCRVTLLTNDEFADLLQSDAFLSRYTSGLEVLRLGPAFPSAPASTLGGLKQRSSLYPKLQFRAWQALRRLRPDLVHLILTPSFFAYAPLFHVLQLPVVMTLSGEMRYVRHFYGPVKRRAVHYAVSQADALVVCSADELENLRAAHPESLGKAHVLDNFTDVARFSPGQKDEALVTFAARLHAEKGALLFLDAVARIHRSLPHARFALLGRGELAGAVDQRIAELGLSDVVERGFVTDLAPHLARSSIFVSCQLIENLGSSSLLEAMASANAVVATDVGQTWRVVDDAVGLRVPSTASAVAEGIEKLLIDATARRQKARAARQRVEERYGPTRYVSVLTTIYGGAMAARTRQ